MQKNIHIAVPVEHRMKSGTSVNGEPNKFDAAVSTFKRAGYDTEGGHFLGSDTYDVEAAVNEHHVSALVAQLKMQGFHATVTDYGE